MQKYRKRPIEVEARQVTEDNFVDMAVWCGGTWYERFFFGKHQTMVVEFKEIGGRDVEAVEGDWIVKGVQGEFYPCKPDIFEATYEVVGLDAMNTPNRTREQQMAWIADQYLRIAFMFGDPSEKTIYVGDAELAAACKFGGPYGYEPHVVGAPKGIVFGWGPS